MFGIENTMNLFIGWAFFFQLVLILHFALRRWRFDLAIRYGPLVYALGIPAAAISMVIMGAGEAWYFWIGGFLCLAWGIFGYEVEYVRKIQWRDPVRWQIFGPYITLYLATIMFYWWPLDRIGKPLWYAYAVLFIISTALNLASHRGPKSFEAQRKTGSAG